MRELSSIVLLMLPVAGSVLLLSFAKMFLLKKFSVRLIFIAITAACVVLAALADLFSA